MNEPINCAVGGMRLSAAQSILLYLLSALLSSAVMRAVVASGIATPRTDAVASQSPEWKCRHSRLDWSDHLHPSIPTLEPTDLIPGDLLPTTYEALSLLRFVQD